MVGRLLGKRAVVTGAASGIGQATAARFVAEGAYVALVDVNADALKTQTALLDDGAGKVRALLADVSEEQQIAHAMAEAESSWGGLDIIVANAAINPLGLDNRA